MLIYRLIWTLILLALSIAPFQRQNEPTPRFADFHAGQPAQAGGSTGIIGLDNRFQILNTHKFPWSAIALIKVHWTEDDVIGNSCTGWMIGPSTIATAAHCVYDHGYPYAATVRPAINADDPDTTPFGSCKVIDGQVRDEWIQSHNIQYDYGVYHLDCTVGLQTGIFPIKATSGDWANKPLQSAGYPGDKPDRTQWSGSGKVTLSTAKGFYYDIDSYPGQSGSPVWDTSDPQCPYCVVAVHSCQFDQATSNFGARIDAEAYTFLTQQSSFRLSPALPYTTHGW